MRLLASPGALAVLATLLAVAIHPAADAGRRLPSGAPVLAGLALLLLLSLVARAFRGGWEARTLALGATLVVGALGYDGVRGHEGTLELAPGAATRNFDEEGPEGRRLGLRPLGFGVLLDRVEGGTAVLSAGRGDAAEEQLVVAPHRAAAFAGVRLSDPEPTRAGEAAAVRVAISGPTGAREAEILPGHVTRVDDLEIALEQYFADFALDEKQQPFSRSTEARNPAVLLEVRRGGQAFRVFAIRALPGIHRQEGLGRSFALVGVEPAVSVRLRVARQPAAAVAAAGAVLAVLGLSLAPRREA